MRSDLLVTLAFPLLVACGGIADDPQGESDEVALAFAQQSLARGLGHDVPTTEPMLADASFVLIAQSSAIRQTYAALTTNQGVLVVSSVSTGCFCGGTGASRLVAATDACAATEKRVCSVVITGETKRAGMAMVDVTDERGDLVQRIPVEVAAAETITPLVRTAPAPPGGLPARPTAPGELGAAHEPVGLHGITIEADSDGTFQVARAQLLWIAPVVRDGAGRELHYTSDADVALEAPADDTVLAHRSALAGAFQAQTAREGASVVTMALRGGKRSAVPIRVIAP